MAPRLSDVPTNELGAPGVTAFGGYLHTYETTPEVTWPHATRTYDLMRRDGHVASVLRAITLPIRRNRHYFDDSANSDVRPEVIDFCRVQFGVDLGESRRRRRRQGVDFGEAFRHALLMLPFGHMVLEQVYEIGPPPPGLDSLGVDQVAHLRKLAPRMPQTISRFHLDDTGSFLGVSQWASDGKGAWREQLLPVDRIVMFVNEREGSDWSGQSILRTAYAHWLFKQQLMRVDAIACERNGLGVPTVTYGPNASKNTALDIAKNLRSGEDAGVALAEGEYSLDLKGVVGSVRDILPSIQYHDQEIARSLLAMFLDLGHSNGARALGDTFVDFFVLAQQAVDDYVTETFTEHVIRDLVEINFGPDEPYPVLCAEEIFSNSEAVANSLSELAKAGLVTADPALEEALRERWGLPAPQPVEPAPPAASEAGLPVLSPLPQANTRPLALEPVAASAGPTLEELEARLAALKANQGRPG